MKIDPGSSSTIVLRRTCPWYWLTVASALPLRQKRIAPPSHTAGVIAEKGEIGFAHNKLLLREW